MKIILLAVLFIIPAMYGFYISKKSENCFKNIKYLHFCLERMHIHITQYLMPLGDIFLELSKEEVEPFAEIYSNIYKRIEKGGESFKNIFLNEFENKKDILGFENEEMGLVSNISELMGSSNVVGQEKYLTSLIKSSEKLLTEREEKYKTKSAAYKKLGILFGLFLVIAFL